MNILLSRLTPVCIGFLFIIIGVGLIFQSPSMWVFLGGILFILITFFVPLEFLILLSILSASFMRVFTYYGICPKFLNFSHFPLVLSAFFSSILVPKYKSKSSFILGLILMIFFVVSFLSWIINKGEVILFVLSWLLFAEPFLLLYAIMKSSPVMINKFLQKLALIIPIAQIPFSIYQALYIGLSDPVQGTFIGQGAGAHVMGAISLLGVLYILSKKIEKFNFNILDFILLFFLFLLPTLADAKQCLVAFVLGFLIFGLYLFKIDFKKAIFVSALCVFALSIIIKYYPPIKNIILNRKVMSKGLVFKIDVSKIIISKNLEKFSNFFIGQGPGQSVSRASLLPLKGYIRSLPKGFLSLKVSENTIKILKKVKFNWIATSSSVWSGVSSWLGVFGDFGFLGLCAYLSLFIFIWIFSSKSCVSYSILSKSALIMAASLGLVFCWLETPEFTIPWITYVGLGLIKRNKI